MKALIYIALYSFFFSSLLSFTAGGSGVRCVYDGYEEAKAGRSEANLVLVCMYNERRIGWFDFF